MSWSWRLGTFGGIDVKVHATFVLLLGWVGVSHLLVDGSVAAAVEGILFILLIFACVVFHEFGHALTARRYGVATRDIVLLPIGGVARLERIPEEPGQELRVAVAGPLVNVGIALLLALWIETSGSWWPVERLGAASGPLAERLLIVNVFLAAFNLIPAFPMDGGRMLRALLAMRLEYTKATQIAARVGQGLALVFGFAGLFGNPLLLFIAFFVWIGAGQEASVARLRSALGGVPVRAVMQTDFRMLQHSDPLSRAVDLTLSGAQTDFPVLEGERIVGILTQADLLAALAKGDALGPVSEAMRPQVSTVEDSEMVEAVMPRLQAAQVHAAPVLRSGRLVGLLTMDNVGEFLSFRRVTTVTDEARGWAGPVGGRPAE